ncbi:PLP-dependent aminotransferase family protein [Acetobacterium sp.]|uniref:MocR-like pyridoxine biosynthesis transcription factor PdxR n=1 Tax=Acetobacterium sp. TaxID=1872094 RepID=UPI000CB172C1|nr:PLP-dependent aminotransferase family protein [Acetobacterium sp.]MDO9493861.1 PLP-dependent aminotransferase family protein [Acetobacterium sp.]PKM70893.1 MAG: GntR family transcriptional regulator [Firmicutes bacterium HGW-Firmicutes-17]
MWINIDKKSDRPLMRQLYDQIKHLILDGRLAPTEKLPSTRQLAADLGISRSTILNAYNQLIAEGYLQGNHGSGTVVASGIDVFSIPPEISVKKRQATVAAKNQPATAVIDFQSGVIDSSQFPLSEWKKAYQRSLDQVPEAAFRYHPSAGVLSLRQTIADYLRRTRGLACDPDQIMIVSGSTQGLALISALFHDQQQAVLIEDPTHPGLRKIIERSKLNLIGIAVDDQGLVTDLLAPQPAPAFIYTTPSHQYPLGGILPIQRRQKLIQYAIANDAYLLEDDYDSEFRFEGQPVSSLYELSPDRVIYLGTFSKILTPAIRLGYLILPKPLIAPYLELKKYSDVHTEALTQYALAEFIDSGGLEKHIWKMKKIYAKKRQHLIDELSRCYPDKFEIKGHAAGLHMVVHFNGIVFDAPQINRINSRQVRVYPINNYVFGNKTPYCSDILLGYAHLTFAEITTGITRLCTALRQPES